MAVESLKIIAGGEAYDNLTSEKLFGVSIKKISPYETLTDAGYKITALPARHAPNSGALIYIIEGEKSILYAHDTGYFYDEVFEYIKDNKIVFDMITLDCTHVDESVSDNDGHMGIENNERVVKILIEMGAVTEKTQKFVNHFSHNSEPFQDRIESLVEPMGFEVSYDGREVEI
jgi:phosphoribosyl 1,2-cyclic phosphate phosphodiesterase